MTEPQYITKDQPQNPSDTRLNILILTPSLPYPPIWGFGIRVYQLIRALSVRHRVTLLTYGRDAKPAEREEANNTAMRSVCAALHLVPPPRLFGGKRGAQLFSLFSPRSFQTGSMTSPAMQERLNQLLKNEKFDLIQVESSQMAAFDFGKTVPMILDEHNLEYELLYRLYKGERSPGRRLYNWAEYVKFHREEQSCWRRAAACLLTSGREYEILKAMLPNKPATVRAERG